MFKDQVKIRRLEAGLTQAQLAEKVNVTTRTIQNYEMGTRNPVNAETVQRLANALGTTLEDLMGTPALYVMEARERGGTQAAKDMEELVGKVTGLFAGGELSEDAMEGAMKALNDAYWIAKEKNRRYRTGKKDD